MPNFDLITQQALKAHGLLVKHASVLDPRLPPGLAAWLVENLTLLGVSVPGQIKAKSGAVAATATQTTTMDNLIAVIGGVRENVKHEGSATAGEKISYAVGIKLDAGSPKRVLAAAGSIIDAARKDSARAAKLGILPADIALLTQLVASATTADTEQDKQRAKAPESTKSRNALVKSIEAATRRVGAAGVLAFAMNATVRAEFEALLASTKSKGGPKGGNPPPAK